MSSPVDLGASSGVPVPDQHTPADSSPSPTAPTVETAAASEAETAAPSSWGVAFDADRLARLETRMWKAYYRRQPMRLFGLLVMANREQAHVDWIRATLAAVFLTRAAVRFSRATGDYDRFAPDLARGYRLLGLPKEVDAVEVGRRELRWWVVRREIGLSAGEAAGQAIARTYAAIYGVPEEAVAEAGRLRGVAAEVRDRGAAADPEGGRGRGDAYWPEVARLLHRSYRELHRALASNRRPAAAIAETGAASASAEAAAAETRPAPNEYHIFTDWQVPATAHEILEVLSEPAALARWWPSVYLDVRVLAEGDARGVGRVVELWTKGWLPYTLRWRFRVTEATDDGFTLAAVGDFVGQGVWTLTERVDAGARVTNVRYDWRIYAEKGVLRRFSFLMKPIFAANHRWAMARGEESLRLEIARRHAAGDPALLAAIPDPPGPTFPHNLRLVRRLGRR